MMDTCAKNQAGFTLIEVMIAIILFAIGILGVATMQTTATGGNAVAMTITELTTVAAQRMEAFKALPIAQLVDINQTTPADTGEAGLDNNGSDATVAGGADYYWSQLGQRGDVIIAANVAPGVPTPISGLSGSTTIRVIASTVNGSRTVTLTSVINAYP